LSSRRPEQRLDSWYPGHPIRPPLETSVVFVPVRDAVRKLVSMTQTIYEAAGGRQAFLNLARAWHARCLADPVVSHAFSHGYHPQHSQRLAATGPRRSADLLTTLNPWVISLVWFECTQETASIWRWTSERRPASRRPWMMPVSRKTPVCEPRSRPTFAGQLRQCQRTRSRQTMSRPVSRWHAGLGAGPRKRFRRPVLERA
jgi:hypothetical protein